MTSLFSSFDLYFCYFQLLFFLFFAKMIVNSFYKFSSFKNFYLSLKNYMEIFFFSLKPNSFSKSYFTFLWTLMFSVVFFNLSSNMPFNFAYTSQVSVVLLISLTSWVALMIFNLFANLKGAFMHFIPEGTPIYLTWFLFGVEIISNLIRPLTLTVRLVANILAGHLLIILLSKLVLGFSPAFLFLILLSLVEMFVSLIQSYIFSTMICLYFSEI